MENVRTLIDAETIAAKVRELGARITEDYRGRDLVLVPVLKGSFVFAADLARAIDLPVAIDFFGCRSYEGTESSGVVQSIDLPVAIDFFGCRSYEGTESSGVVQTTLDLSRPIEGKDVIVVEDIVDTGLTMAYMLEAFETRRPRSLKLASLLHKPARTRVPVDIHYLGFAIDDVFVVGYGLDFDERYRNLSYLGVLER